MEKDHTNENAIISREELKNMGKETVGGKYRGKTFEEVHDSHRDYCYWALGQQNLFGFLKELVKYVRARQQFEELEEKQRKAQATVHHKNMRYYDEGPPSDEDQAYYPDDYETLESFTSRYIDEHKRKGWQGYCWDFLEHYECYNPVCRFKHDYPPGWTEAQRQRHRSGIATLAMPTVEFCSSCCTMEEDDAPFELCDTCSFCQECCECCKCKKCGEKFDHFDRDKICCNCSRCEDCCKCFKCEKCEDMCDDNDDFCLVCLRCEGCRSKSCIEGDCEGCVASVQGDCEGCVAESKSKRKRQDAETGESSKEKRKHKSNKANKHGGCIADDADNDIQDTGSQGDCQTPPTQEQDNDCSPKSKT